jgi:hypothetical protein
MISSRIANGTNIVEHKLRFDLPHIRLRTCGKHDALSRYGSVFFWTHLDVSKNVGQREKSRGVLKVGRKCTRTCKTRLGSATNNFFADQKFSDFSDGSQAPVKKIRHVFPLQLQTSKNPDITEILEWMSRFFPVPPLKPRSGARLALLLLI